MRKITVIILMLACMALLAACTEEQSKQVEQLKKAAQTEYQTDLSNPNSFFDFFDDPEISAFSKRLYESPPDSLTYIFNGETSGTPVTITSPDDITAILKALSIITVQGESETISTDNEHIFTFAFSNGSSISFCFNGHSLAYDQKVYLLENDSELWTLTEKIFE